MARSKGPRYTPVAKRQDRPDAIAWLLKVHPELQDSQVAKLVGSTKSTVQSVRDRTHWNMQNVRPRDPVTLGLCSLKDLNDAVDKARRKAAREDAARKKAKAKAGETEAAAASPQPPIRQADPADADQPDVGETQRRRENRVARLRPSASPCRHGRRAPARRAPPLRRGAETSCR